MAISAKQKWIGYALALAATLAAVRWADGQDPAEPAAPRRADRGAPAAEAPRAQPTAPRGAERPDPVSAQEVQLAKLGNRAHDAPATNPFGARSWQQMAQEEARKAAPPPPPPPPPPKPQAPPLQFTFMGKMIEDGQITLFLVKQDRNYIVRKGETIDNTYRVDDITENRLSLTYLPLDIRQEMPLAAAN